MTAREYWESKHNKPGYDYCTEICNYRDTKTVKPNIVTLCHLYACHVRRCLKLREIVFPSSEEDFDWVPSALTTFKLDEECVPLLYVEVCRRIPRIGNSTSRPCLAVEGVPLPTTFRGSLMRNDAMFASAPSSPSTRP